MPVQDSQHEDIKEWVLAVSMDQRVTQELPMDERDTYEGSLVAINTGIRSLPCVITGITYSYYISILMNALRINLKWTFMKMKWTFNIIAKLVCFQATQCCVTS